MEEMNPDVSSNLRRLIQPLGHSNVYEVGKGDIRQKMDRNGRRQKDTYRESKFCSGLFSLQPIIKPWFLLNDKTLQQPQGPGQHVAAVP